MKKNNKKSTRITINMTAAQLALYNDIDATSNVEVVARNISRRLSTIATRARNLPRYDRAIYIDDALWDVGEVYRDSGAGDTMTRGRMERAIHKAIAASR